MLIFCQNEQLLATYCEILDSFQPVSFTNQETLLKQLQQTDFLLIDEDVDFCKKLLESNTAPAILLISQTDSPSEEISFLKKPITAESLFKKVSLLVRRQEKGLLVNFTINGFTFCGQKRTVNNVPLTQKEAELIELLYENKDRILSKEEILQTIFGYTQQVQTHTLETHIYKLRQKINDVQADFIVTKEGGYGLNIEKNE